MHDPVNKPQHYRSDPSGVECIQITRHRTFIFGNAIKYLWRAGLKDEAKTIEDLEKAIFYIKDEIGRLRGNIEKPDEEHTSTGISIDFSGEEMVELGNACIATGETFCEFIDRAIRNLVAKHQPSE